MKRISTNLKHFVLLPFCTLFIFGGAITVEAATYYVATTGSDTSTGTQSQPFLTIKKGLSALLAGDTLYIRGGTYPEQINSNAQTIPTGTSWSAPVTISGYPGETVILNPAGCEVFNLPASYLQYIIFKHMILDGTNLTKSSTMSCVGISLQPATHHLRFENLDVKNSPWSGIQGGGSYHEFINLKVHDSGAWTMEAGYGPGSNGAYLMTDYSIIDGGEYYNNQCFGVRFFNSNTQQPGDHNAVKSAKIYTNGHGVAFNGKAVCNSGGGGIVLGDTNNAAYNNLIYGNYWGFITSGSKPSGVLVYNNTFYKNMYGIDINATSVNAQVTNNILSQNGFGIQNAGSGTVFSANLCSTSGLGCSLIGDPQFVNPTGYDLRLQAGSPAIDKGIPLSIVVDDFAGVSRPKGSQFDIGAHEANGTTDVVSPLPPTNLVVQ